MTKRLLVVVAVAVALFVLAAPAMAFNGFRGTYVLTGYCSTCHYEEGIAQPVYDEWVQTGHARTHDEAIVRGAGCAGCHVGNYSPEKHVPTAPGTFPTAVEGTQGSGNSGFSEAFVGCSSCHYGVNVGPNEVVADLFGNDPANTGHRAPTRNMASAEICGQCHARYSATVQSYASWTWPSASPSPVATTVRTQGSLGDFNPLGAAPEWSPAAITDYLNVSTAANPVGGAFWQGGQSKNAHGEGAVQYGEWKIEGHANALTGLTGQDFWKSLPEATKQGCLECHSTDFVMMEEAGEQPQSTDAQHGVTCVGCHKPHEEGSQTAVWNKDKNPQLKMPRAQLCVQCHNGELPVNGEAAPGDEIHHPMKEMLAGYGAIDVANIPMPGHKGQCVRCHMVPTGYEYNGAVATAGNHVFAVVTPDEAVTQQDSQGRPMPYDSCTQCHATAEPQAFLDNTQEWTTEQIVRIRAILETAATNLGYEAEVGPPEVPAIDVAHEALMAKPSNTWTTAERAFLSAWTNAQFVESEGSFGVHNFDYTKAIVNTAMSQAKIAETGVAVKLPWVVTFKLSKTSVAAGTSVTFSGTVKTAKGVAGAGPVQIWRRPAGVGNTWKLWRSVTLNASGQYSTKTNVSTKGTSYWRATMPADTLNRVGTSTPNIKLVVK